MPPNHIGRWTKAVFKKITEKHGWSVEHYGTEMDTLIAKINQYVKYRYMREIQRKGSWANRVEIMNVSGGRTLMRAVLVSFYTLATFPAVLELVVCRDLGNSQWVQLKKLS